MTSSVFAWLAMQSITRTCMVTSSWTAGSGGSLGSVTDDPSIISAIGFGRGMDWVDGLVGVELESTEGDLEVRRAK